MDHYSLVAELTVFMLKCTGMLLITTFRSATDRIYDGGLI